MSRKRFLVFSLMFSIVALITACSSQPNNIDVATGQPETQGEQNTVSSSEPFQAEASSAVSVALSWAPVDGVEAYVVELSFGGDYFPIAVLDAGQTSFRGFSRPG